jgi:transcriptional regulator with XRE-family HTH domain
MFDISDHRTMETTDVDTVVQPLARNLRHWRRVRGLTLSALAEQAGVAKSTVSLLERGQGNPSIDTIWSLANALGVPFANLFHDNPVSDGVTVLRANAATVVGTDDAGLDYPPGLLVHHLLTRTGGALFEVYVLTFAPGATRQAQGHVSGIYEHLYILEGTIEISTDLFCEVVAPGDLISFVADRPHQYRVIEGPVRFVSIHEYPPPTPD